MNTSKQSFKTLSRTAYIQWLHEMDPSECLFCKYPERQLIIREYHAWRWVGAVAPYWPYHTMLVPRRHVVSLDTLHPDELHEFISLQRRILAYYQQAELKWPNGNVIENYAIFWRQRTNSIDKLTGVYKTDHLHIHFAPDREHLWNAAMDKQAYKVPLDPLLTVIDDKSVS